MKEDREDAVKKQNSEDLTLKGLNIEGFCFIKVLWWDKGKGTKFETMKQKVGRQKVETVKYRGFPLKSWNHETQAKVWAL